MTPANGVLSVAPAAIVVSADNKSRDFGAANPAFTGSLSGFRLGETSAVLTGTLLYTTPATLASLPGTYAIVPGGLSASNYTLTYVPGILSVGTAVSSQAAAFVDANGLSVNALVSALQGSQVGFRPAMLSVPLSGFGGINALPATAAGGDVPGNQGQGDASSGFADVAEVRNAVRPRVRIAFRSECFGSAIQQLQCASR